jgi:hypothetical protein
VCDERLRGEKKYDKYGTRKAPTEQRRRLTGSAPTRYMGQSEDWSQVVDQLTSHRPVIRLNYAEPVIGTKTDSIKCGFIKHFVDFIAKKGRVTVAKLQKEFTGRQFNNKKVTNERVVRYAYWGVAQGILKVAAKPKAAKAASI